MALRKYLYALVAAATLGLTACDDYDDGALWDAVNDHESRIEALEQWQEQVNGNIAALQQLLSTTDYITKVTPIREDGRQVGYTIEFLNQPPITIYNGDKGDTGAPGQNGDDGQDGADGTDGTDGKDGQTPEIGLVKGDDGNWYWTVNGEMILDDDGNPIRANGHDGADGGDGQPGQDGKPGADGTDGQPGGNATIPQIALGGTLAGGTYYGIGGKQESSPTADAWYISVDGGKTWHRISGDKGDTGGTGADGPQGNRGEQGDAWLAGAPEISEDGMYYIFTLSDDDNTDLSDNPTFKVPVYQGFSLGTGTLSITSETTVIDITLPAGTTAGDYQAMIAKITPEDGMSTRTGGSLEGWSVEADLANLKVTVTTAQLDGGSKAMLRVTLLRNDGSEITASRMVAVPDYEIVDGAYIVYSADGLYAWLEAVSSISNQYLNCTLKNDITLPDAPEGGSNWTPMTFYSGTFDGAGHTISNLVTGWGSPIGFIQFLRGTVKNLHLANAEINGNTAGGIAGIIQSGNITACSVSGSINGETTGGIAGTNQSGNITACSVSGSTINGNTQVGGIAGFNYGGNITACSVSGNTINGNDRLGGIAGYNNGGNITACSVSGGTITGNDRLGGIAGINYGNITACYTTADVKGNGDWTGAFAGVNMSGITAGYWQTDTKSNAIGHDLSGSQTTKVEGDVTWKTATDAMNAAIPNDGSCPYRYVQRDGDNNPPVIEHTGE